MTEYDNFKAEVLGLLKESLNFVPKIHGIVMPELSLSSKQFLELKEIAEENNLFLCAGIGDDTKHTNTLAWSMSEDLKPGKIMIDERQSKHHRWSLEESQLKNYGLSAYLSPDKRWWEYMQLEKRKLRIFNYGFTTICSLICEDLARQDPAASIIRAIAPNLVIALLMDGPQLSGRWPARYASILADDPGCAVLTFTSFGLIELSNRVIKSNSRVVALWRDKTSNTKEISLENNEVALILTLTPKERKEVSADGRVQLRPSSLVYSGHHGLSLRSGSETPKVSSDEVRNAKPAPENPKRDRVKKI